jgi:dolichyl-phosphate-mannose-protein mannosyltransferase
MGHPSLRLSFLVNSNQRNFYFSPYWTIIAIWLFASFWNFNKAYHIDDTAHLEIAHWIAENPWHPMSGLMSWDSDFEPIYQTNQPHLYFYLMAFWAQLFGWNEISMHMLMSLFVFWAIVEFYKLAKIVAPNSALLSTSLLGLSPAFVVGQNSMVDIPLLAVWMSFFRILLNPEIADSRRYGISAVLCSAGVMIKYTSLLLIPGLFFHIIISKRYSYLFWILVPFMTLLAWSLFNIYDYGGIHILGRKTGSAYSSKYIAVFHWIVALGAISPFALYLLIAKFRRATSLLSRYVWMLALLMCCLPPALICLSFLFSQSADTMNKVLAFAFFVTGIGLLLIAIVEIGSQLIRLELSHQKWVLVYWLVSSFLFIILLAPFIATRHVLLSIPPLLLLLFSWCDNLKMPKTAIGVIFVSIFITSLLAAADNWYADIYRKNSFIIRDNLPKQTTVWFTGHWGWQWYAAQAGMQQLSARRDHPTVGDFIVTPDHIDPSKIPDHLVLTLEKTITIQREHWYQHFATLRFYESRGLVPPLSYSNNQMETFSIWKVVG